jgi:hypothetical protein
VPMRPTNIKMFPDSEPLTERADRFVSEMIVYKSLDDARAAMTAHAEERARAREARRHSYLMEG